jgi:AraC-like DNA-binding protein
MTAPKQNIHDCLSDLDRLGIGLSRRYFNIAFLLCRSSSGLLLSPPDENSIEQLLAGFRSEGLAAYAKRSGNSCELLINYQTHESLGELTTAILAHFPDTLLAFSGVSENPEDIPSLYEKAVYISSYRRYPEGYRIIRYEDHVGMLGAYYYPIQQEFALSVLLTTNQQDEAKEAFEKLYAENKNRGDITEEGLRVLLVNIILTARRSMSAPDVKALPLSRLIALENESLYQYALKSIDTACRANETPEGNSLLFSRVAEYVDKSFNDSGLSLRSVADVFGVSVSFISKLFKEKGQINFHRYINEKRIEQAKKFLTDENFTILDIAKKVGYENDVTFRRLFKLYTGVNPSIYRDINNDAIKI